MKRRDAAIKRTMDVVMSGAALLILSPLMALAAIAVRFSSDGSILFRQQRLGQCGQIFTIYKFRTMRADAMDIRNPDGSTFNAALDPRVTPIGGILRKSSIDELPQLFNILRGEMSLVGPRPDLPDQLRFYTDRQKKRFLVKPGMTGWASIHGRNDISWERRRELDMEYVEKYSIWLDLEILGRTIPMVLLGRGVHMPGGLRRPTLEVRSKSPEDTTGENNS